MPSEADCEDGRDMAARGWIGLNSPGDEIGVLVAVREGGCRVLAWVFGAKLLTTVASKGGDGSMVSSKSWVRSQVGEESVLVAAANRHNGLGRGGLTEATKTSIRTKLPEGKPIPSTNTERRRNSKFKLPLPSVRKQVNTFDKKIERWTRERRGRVVVAVEDERKASGFG